MTDEFEYKGELTEELELGALLNDITQFLGYQRPLVEMRQMDQDVAEVITDEEYQQFARYKQYCMEELGALNCTSGPNGVLNSSIERGFIVGYWLAMQHQNNKGETVGGA